MDRPRGEQSVANSPVVLGKTRTALSYKWKLLADGEELETNLLFGTLSGALASGRHLLYNDQAFFGAPLTTLGTADPSSKQPT
jgi:hypothetical protein